MKEIWIPSLVDVFSGIIYHNPVPSPAGQTRHGRSGRESPMETGLVHSILGSGCGECGRIPGHPARFGFQDRFQPPGPLRTEVTGNRNHSPDRMQFNRPPPDTAIKKGTPLPPKTGRKDRMQGVDYQSFRERPCPSVSRNGIGYRLRRGGLSIFAPKQERQIDSGL